jgi:BirA family biotin operon repressor/biotin-[acetyl-CoA-carboxylase] ligase
VTQAAAPGWRLDMHEAMPSTQDACHAAARAGAPGRLAVLAKAQSRGRGTKGRLWHSPPGNLFLSVLLRPEEPARTTGEWSLLAAVALADALAAILPGASRALALKWPNDVLLHGRKLAGILTEGEAQPDGRLAFLVIGFGVNLASAPDIPDRPAICVAEVAPPPAPEAFAPSLLARLDHWQARRRHQGFAVVRDAWLGRGPAPGAAIVICSGGVTRRGAFAGLDADGSLLLATGARVQAFAAGEVLAELAGAG